LDEVTITSGLIEQITPKIARKYRVFPVRSTEGVLWVALSDPLDIQTADDLRMILGKEVRCFVAEEAKVAKAIEKYYSEGVDDVAE